jgi:hypothetical protein
LASQPLRRLDPSPSDPGFDPAPAQIGAAMPGVVPLVGVDRPRPAAPATRRHAHRWDIVDQLLEDQAVVDVGGRQRDGKGEALAVADQVELGSWLAAVDRICANVVPPL